MYISFGDEKRMIKLTAYVALIHSTVSNTKANIYKPEYATNKTIA